MLEVYVKNDQLDGAFKILRKMQKDDTKPTLETFTLLYEGVAKRADIAMMKMVIEEIKASKIKIDDELKNNIQAFMTKQGEEVDWGKKAGGEKKTA